MRFIKSCAWRAGERRECDVADYEYVFDPKRYDLAKVGRFKYNQKMAIGARIKGQKLAHDVVDPQTGEILASAGDVLSADTAMQIQHTGVNRVVGIVDDKEVVIFRTAWWSLQTMCLLMQTSSMRWDSIRQYARAYLMRFSLRLRKRAKDGAEDLKAALLRAGTI